MEDQETLLARITGDPHILAGKPCIRGIRISVEQILDALVAGQAGQEIIAEHPDLELEDITAALLYAKELVLMERVYPVASAE